MTGRLEHGMGVALALFLAAASLDVRAQEVDARTNLNSLPWTSPRGMAMGGALAPFATGLDAPGFNPAGIGRASSEGKSGPWIRELYFPALGAAVNENAVGISKQLASQGGHEDEQIAANVLDASEGKRQYARLSLVPSITIGRFLLGVRYDEQMAAVATGQDGVVSLARRVDFGPMAGFAVGSPTGSLELGAFTTLLDRTEVSGDFSYQDLDGALERRETLARGERNYSALQTNVGLSWRIAETARPTLAVVARDLGGTKLKAGGGFPSQTIPENLTVAFGVSPTIGRWAALNLALEADRIGDTEVGLKKKLRLGTELTFGSRRGDQAVVALRAGLTDAGASYGLGLNLGLLGLQAASYAEDISLTNQRVIERRKEAILTVNVADY